MPPASGGGGARAREHRSDALREAREDLGAGGKGCEEVGAESAEGEGEEEGEEY